MKTIVITGSTRGIGFGMAKELLARDCAVLISGRTDQSTQTALHALKSQSTSDQVAGFACDVRSYKAVQDLWDYCNGKFGQVDIWINNAGLSGAQAAIWEIDPTQAQTVVETNLLGVIYGSMVAVQGMLSQGSGSLYNMEGLGSDGRKLNGLACYGTTKYAVSYFTDSLVRETAGTPLVIGALRPGMVITDMILNQYRERPEEWLRVKKIFNIIASRVEDVAPWLAEQVLKNQKSGVRLSYTSNLKLMGRMLVSPFHKRNIID